jgi:hypothetical protein
MIEIVLAKVINCEERYFNIHERITGKWGYVGMNTIENASEGKWLKPNEIVTLERLHV